MTQFDYGTIDPNTKSGTDLASDLNSFRDALNSLHKGGSRPSYVAAGMVWLDDTTATAWVINLYDGTDDIPLFTVDSTNNYALGQVSKVESKSGAYTAILGDRGKLIRFTATATLSLTAAATLGDGWYCDYKSSTGTLTIDPDASETIDGATTITVLQGQSVRVYCNGSAFFSTAVPDTSTTIKGLIKLATTAQIRSKAALLGITVPNIFTALAPVALTDGATIVFDCDLRFNGSVTLGGNRTLNFTNPQDQQSGEIDVTQDGTGSRTLAFQVTGGSGAVLGTAPTLSTTAGARDILGYKFMSATEVILWVVELDV